MIPFGFESFMILELVLLGLVILAQVRLLSLTNRRILAWPRTRERYLWFPSHWVVGKLHTMAVSWPTIWQMDPRLGWTMRRSSGFASNFTCTISVTATTVAVIEMAVMVLLKMLTLSASHFKTIDAVDKDVVNE